MNKHLTPTTPITLDGTMYRLCFDFDAIAEAEDILDRSLLTGLRKQDIESPRISFVRAMLFAGLHAKHPQLTLDTVKSFVTRKNLAEVWGTVLTAWVASVQEPDADEVTEDRPLAETASVI